MRFLDTSLHLVQGNHCKPDAHTYSTLIDAYSRAEQPGIALKVYERAMAQQVQRCTAPLLRQTLAVCRAHCDKIRDFSMPLRRYAEAMAHTQPPTLHTSIQKQTLHHRLYSLQVTDNLVLYDAAITACKACPESVDVKEAMRIYADMQRCALNVRLLCQLNPAEKHPELSTYADMRMCPGDSMCSCITGSKPSRNALRMLECAW